MIFYWTCGYSSHRYVIVYQVVIIYQRIVYNRPIGIIYSLYTRYILPSNGLYNPYHLLPEPEKSIDIYFELWDLSQGLEGQLTYGIGFSMIGHLWDSLLTLWYTNSSHLKNGWLKDEWNLGMAYFQWLLPLCFKECNLSGDQWLFLVPLKGGR